MQNLKKYIMTMVMALGFVVAPGLSTAQAQWWPRQDRRNDRRDEARERERARQRYEWERRQRNRNNNPWGYGDGRYENDRWGNDRWGNGRNGNYGYSAEEQKGYRDGLDRGQKDAKTNRVMDPNNSSHYRKGSQAYREGFRRGFFEGYRQYSNRRW
jgi:hypothetical protein